MNGLRKYYVGLAVLGVFTLGLGVYVLAQGNSYKNDKRVNEVLSEIADDLNSYVRTEQQIPESLSDATSQQVPAEVTYTKESDSKYKVCVTYSSGSGPELNANSIVYQGLSGDYSSSFYDYESDYVPSTLYVSTYSWREGETCYVVAPNIRRSNSSNIDLFNGSSLNLDYLCDESSEYYEFYEDDCVNGVYQY